MAVSNTAAIGLIGGSGLYEMAALTDKQEHVIETPFGRPSDPVVVGEGVGVSQLGRSHVLQCCKGRPLRNSEVGEGE